jgi:Excalibur calcium-binding domain
LLNSGYKYLAVTWRAALLTIVFSGNVTAHPGGLNAEGCHNDRKRGEYHCHGQRAPAVQRPAHERPLNLKSPQQKSAANCGTKRYCKEMVNCAEAVHYLYSCGLKRLDSDRDGIPCETLCGNRQVGTNQVERILRSGQ